MQDRMYEIISMQGNIEYPVATSAKQFAAHRILCYINFTHFFHDVKQHNAIPAHPERAAKTFSAHPKAGAQLPVVAQLQELVLS